MMSAIVYNKELKLQEWLAKLKLITDLLLLCKIWSHALINVVLLTDWVPILPS